MVQLALPLESRLQCYWCQMNDEELDQVPGEEVTRRNILSIRDYTVRTRALIRALEEQVAGYSNQVIQLQETVNQLQQQVAIARGMALDGGPTNGD